MADLFDKLTDSLNGVGAAGAVGAAGSVLDSLDSEEEGKAVGEVEGRRMAVMTPGGQGMEALVSAINSIALLGLPVKGALKTAAVGSKL